MAKRTIEEVYILLNKKRENAIRNKDIIIEDTKKENKPICRDTREHITMLNVEIQAYTDVIILLETSGLIKPEDNEKDMEAFFR